MWASIWAHTKLKANETTKKSENVAYRPEVFFQLIIGFGRKPDHELLTTMERCNTPRSGGAMAKVSTSEVRLGIEGGSRNDEHYVQHS